MSFSSNFYISIIIPFIVFAGLLIKDSIKGRKVFLLLFNTVFICSFGISGSVILICFILLDCLFVQLNEEFQKKVFPLFIILEVLPLVFYKYYGLFIAGLGIRIQESTVVMPVGISFYTFQSISFLSDVYKERINKNVKFADVVLYLTFFAYFVSGPITRYTYFSEQLENRGINREDTENGLIRFIIGLSKKVLLADNLALFANNVFDFFGRGGSFSVVELWLASFAYMLQLYMDFSGYSDMSIGMAQIVGIHLPENFIYPYTSRSLQSFWRKWHISLSQWFRDYVYIPLGGNRVTVSRHIFNMLVVWCLTGMWHGANLSFIVWGFLNFIILIFEKYCSRVSDYMEKHFVGHIVTLFVVNLIWIFFRMTDIKLAFSYVVSMFGLGKGYASFDRDMLHIIPLLLTSFICSMPVIKKMVFKNKLVKYGIIIVLLLLSVFSISNTSVSPFIYGQF